LTNLNHQFKIRGWTVTRPNSNSLNSIKKHFLLKHFFNRFEIEDLFNQINTANNILQINLPLELQDGKHAEVWFLIFSLLSNQNCFLSYPTRIVFFPIQPELFSLLSNQNWFLSYPTIVVFSPIQPELFSPPIQPELFSLLSNRNCFLSYPTRIVFSPIQPELFSLLSNQNCFYFAIDKTSIHIKNTIFISFQSLFIQTRNSKRFAVAPFFLAFRALRAHLLFKLWTCSFCLHFKTKKKKFCVKTHFKIFLSIINLPRGHVMSNKKFGPDRFSRFDVYCTQTNRQAKFIYR